MKNRKSFNPTAYLLAIFLIVFCCNLGAKEYNFKYLSRNNINTKEWSGILTGNIDVDITDSFITLIFNKKVQKTYRVFYTLKLEDSIFYFAKSKRTYETFIVTEAKVYLVTKEIITEIF